MGCWNGTCGVTQISINEGEPCRVLLLQKTPGYADPGGFCYHIGDWAPMCMPIKGKYNGYGTLEDFEDNLSAFHDFEIQRLKGNWVEPSPDQHQASQEGFLQTLTWGGVLQNVERDLGCVRLGPLRSGHGERPDLSKPLSFGKPRKDREVEILEAITNANWTKGFPKKALEDIASSRAYQEETSRKLERMVDYVRYFDESERSGLTQIGMVLVHEEIYQMMVAKMKAVVHWGASRPLGEFYREQIQGAVDGYKNLGGFVDECRKAQESGDKEAGVKAYLEERKARDEIFKVARSFEGERIGCLDYQGLFQVLAEHEAPAPLLAELVDFVCFDGAMAAMRKHYSPQGGKGSQGEERDLYLAVNEAVAGVFSKRREEEEG